jgi:hypothetical protein
MGFFDQLTGRASAPKLTRGRIVLAMAMALAADALQVPFAIPPGPEIIDIIAMLLTVGLLGFHVLLLPTFVVEFIPLAGTMLPTWTACVGAVIVLRKRAEAAQPPVIDVDSTTSTTPQQSLPPKSNVAPPSALPPKIDQLPAGSDSNPS